MPLAIPSSALAFTSRGLLDYLTLLNSLSADRGTGYLVVGAFARDLLLTRLLGAARGTQTEDIDVGIYLPDWDAYRRVTDTLLAAGYRRGKVAHELIGPHGLYTDLLPFGGIEDGRQVSFSPTATRSINMMGFREAYSQRIEAIIDDHLRFHVPSPAGLILLKLIAWNDRYPHPVAGKHVTDIGLLLEPYFEATIEQTESDPHLKDIFDRLEEPLPIYHTATVIGRRIRWLVDGDPSVLNVLQQIRSRMSGTASDLVAAQLAGPLYSPAPVARKTLDYLFAGLFA